jgi:hypothetical protein
MKRPETFSESAWRLGHKRSRLIVRYSSFELLNSLRLIHKRLIGLFVQVSWSVPGAAHPSESAYALRFEIAA